MPDGGSPTGAAHGPASPRRVSETDWPGHSVTGANGATPFGPAAMAPVEVWPGSGEPSATSTGATHPGSVANGSDASPRTVTGNRPSFSSTSPNGTWPSGPTTNVPPRSISLNPPGCVSPSTHPVPGAQLPWSARPDPVRTRL